MAWKSSFRQNYRTTFWPKVPTSAAGISHVVANVEAHIGKAQNQGPTEKGQLDTAHILREVLM